MPDLQYVAFVYDEGYELDLERRGPDDANESERVQFLKGCSARGIRVYAFGAETQSFFRNAFPNLDPPPLPPRDGPL